MPTLICVAKMRRRAWIGVAGLILLIMMPNLIWLRVGQGATAWIQGAIVPALLLIILFATCGIRIWLACLLLMPFAALAPLEALYIAKYLHPTNSEILATLVATNPREMYEYLGSALFPALGCITASLIIAFLATWWAKRSEIRWGNRSRNLVLTTAVALPILACVFSFFIPANLHAGRHMLTALSDSIDPGYPFGVVERIVQYRHELHQVEINASSLDSYRFHARRSRTISERQVYVLVIGESSRRNHWQLFGYSRATNPELGKTQNLVPIPNMVTAWPVSIMAIPQILTRKPITDTAIPWREASILRAVQEAGFETWWISNQLPIGKFDSPVATYAFEAEHSIYLNHASLVSAGSYDDVLLQPLRDVLRDSSKDLFVVLHMMGSHLNYDLRYPAGFKKFQPTYDDIDSDVAPGERMLNSYDNTILYTDHVLAQVINLLKSSNSVTAMFYASDHGEALVTPSCSQAGHGIGTRYEFEIPALFWYSDAYAKLFPQRLLALRANALKPSMSADIFESMIDMTNVDFPDHDEGRSLFSFQWRFRSRIVNPIWQTDFDKATFEKKCEIVLPPNTHAGA